MIRISCTEARERYLRLGFILIDDAFKSTHFKHNVKCITCDNFYKKPLHGISNCNRCFKKLRKNITNSIAETHPELCKEWNYIKNGYLTPNMVSLGCHEIVWWICKFNIKHEWSAIIKDRAQKNARCPICCNRLVVSGLNSLADKYPDIAKQWHPTKNNIKANAVAPGAHKNFWWICAKDNRHEWCAAPETRINGHNCPICANLVIMPELNSLEASNPDFLKEWHPTKNILIPSMVAPKSEKIFWWMCSKDNTHEWKATANARYKNGCPQCFSIISKPQKEIFNYLISIYDDEKIILNARRILNRMDLDIYIPELKIGIEYDGEYWHYSDTALSRGSFQAMDKKELLCLERNIKLIRIREKFWIKHKERVFQQIIDVIEHYKNQKGTSK